ncbi:MAG TPA: response regulator [Noviherbaspirillum sp.]|uniref:response regulator n=1 Tax=Noviherbaspirillum sp. TaxID=1926288 RepID=UPI002F94741F
MGRLEGNAQATQHVLLVEDDPASMELLVYLLEASGYAALPAVDDQQGLASARDQRPALVVCDLHRARSEGRDLIRALRDDPSLHDIPALAVVPLDVPAEREALLAAGFDGCIGRPLDPEAFMREAARFLVLPAAAASMGDAGAALPGGHACQPPERRQEGESAAG